MSRLSFSSLRARLLLLVLFAIVPAFGLILYSSLEQRRLAVAKAWEDARRFARLTSESYGRVLEGSRQLLQTLGELPEVYERREAACGRLFGRMLTTNRRYANLGAANLNGKVFCSAVPLGASIDVGDQEWFQHAVHNLGFAVSDYQIGHISGEASVILVHPSFDNAGKLQALVYASLNLTWLHQIAASADLPEQATLTVLSRTGTILDRYPDPEQWVGKSFPETPIIKAVLAGGKGTRELAGLDDIPRLYAFQPIVGGEDAQFYVLIGVSKDSALKEVNRLLRRDLTALGLVAILALAATWFGSDLLLLRQVRALTDATKRLAAGDLSARSAVQHKAGELAELSRSFNEMAGSLELAVAERKRVEDAIHKLNVELEQRVLERTAELEAANKELEAFSYSVSHDLRAPLRAIDGFSRLVVEEYGGHLDAEGQRFLTIIRTNTKKMGDLIDDLLAFAQLGRKTPRQSIVDMTALARSVVEELRQVRDRPVEVTIEPLAPALGDSAMIRQAVSNLVSNALKFTRRHPHPAVTIACRRDGEAHIYSVKDNGVGFDMQYAHKLFGVFQRLHGQEEFEGTGVGLALVQRIIQRHGGRIWAEAVVDKGATFSFTLQAAELSPPTPLLEGGVCHERE